MQQALLSEYDQTHKARENGNSLATIQEFINKNDIISKVLLIKHEASLNWSQAYRTTKERISGLKEVYAPYNGAIETHWLSRDELFTVELSDLKARCDSQQVFSLASLVKTEYGDLHFPIMNFHPRSGVRMSDIISYLKYISNDSSGVLLKTDRFYHYIGFYFLTPVEWLEFLGKMLVPFIFVNPGYIGYSLLRGYCCIRLTSAGEIKTVVPHVIKEF